jgi:hypothetical protein
MMNTRVIIKKATDTIMLCLYKEGISYKLFKQQFGIKCFLFSFFIFAIFFGCDSASAKLIIHSKTAVAIELVGFNALAETPLFKGKLQVDENYEVKTFYKGLALVVFTQGQSYPIIIDQETITVKITSPAEPPFFSGSAENNFFYKALTANAPIPAQYTFADLMIQAKNLIDSSHSIHTVEELTTKKQEFHHFVDTNAQSLKYSNMIRRLIAQYFMMHEYVDYHTEGAPATDIKKRYQQAVLSGVKSWLEILKPHIPEHEILNYCVSLYYNRSMVTLAGKIIDNFRDVAYCPGNEKEKFDFHKKLLVTSMNNKDRKLSDVQGNKLISFVSDDCPVSMVETIIKVRKLAKQKKDVAVVVVPLQELSKNHLTMSNMVRNSNMFFINDEKWRKDNLAEKIKLPLFVKPQNTTQ